MAEDDWGATEQNNSNNSWGTYGWNDQATTTINHNSQPTYVTQTQRQQPRQQQPAPRPSPKKDGFSSLFVAETSFPSWEDQ